MKKIIVTALIAVAGFGVAGLSMAEDTASAKSALKEVEMANEKQVTFEVARMTCATCPITVRKAMEKVKGVKSVKTNFAEKTAIVVFDSSVATTAEIAKASEMAGYPAELVG